MFLMPNLQAPPHLNSQNLGTLPAHLLLYCLYPAHFLQQESIPLDTIKHLSLVWSMRRVQSALNLSPTV
jgi:hypothetical protein